MTSRYKVRSFRSTIFQCFHQNEQWEINRIRMCLINMTLKWFYTNITLIIGLNIIKTKLVAYNVLPLLIYVQWTFFINYLRWRRKTSRKNFMYLNVYRNFPHFFPYKIARNISKRSKIPDFNTCRLIERWNSSILNCVWMIILHACLYLRVCTCYYYQKCPKIAN